MFLISSASGTDSGIVRVVAAAYLMIFHPSLASVLCVLCVDVMVVRWTSMGDTREGAEGK